MRWSSVRVLIAIIIFSLSVAAWAQEQPSQATSDGVSQHEQQKGLKKADGAEKPGPEEFTDAVVDTLLSQIRRGLQGHSSSEMLSAFDPESMTDYRSFKDHLAAMFDQYESFRVYYQTQQISSDEGRGVALVNFTIEEVPSDSTLSPVRKASQVRFQFERGKQGWKIVEFTPRGFFS